MKNKQTTGLKEIKDVQLEVARAEGKGVWLVGSLVGAQGLQDAAKAIRGG